MQKPGDFRQKTPQQFTRDGASYAPVTLRSVPQLPFTQTRPMGRALLARTTLELERTVLDANVQGRRIEKFKGAWCEEAGPVISQRLAQAGASSWEPIEDPLFWLLRIRGDDGPTTHPPVNLEYAGLTTSGRTLPPGPAPSETYYRSMAAWTCRLLPPDPVLRAVCLQIRDQVRDTRRGPKTHVFPSVTARAWLRWFGAARSSYIAWPLPSLGTITTHSDRWQDMALTPDIAAEILGALERPRHPSQS